MSCETNTGVWFKWKPFFSSKNEVTNGIVFVLYAYVNKFWKYTGF